MSKMKIVHNRNKLIQGAKIYTCSVCDQSFNWGCESSWFGSYWDLENNPEKLQTICSKECSTKRDGWFNTGEQGIKIEGVSKLLDD